MPDLFRSYWMGGFECSSHRRPDGDRLDVIAASGHDRAAASDYRLLAAHGIRTVRDGLRWPLIETAPGRYDWSSLLPQLRAARETGTQVIWDLCHYGVPDDLDLWKPEFVERFAAFARAAAGIVSLESDETPWWCPINEISFWSWAGGDAGFFPPFARGRGFELKVQLARAALAAADAVRDVDPHARFLWAEPAIHVACSPDQPADVPHAEGHRLSQFQAWDLLAGRLWPQIGGREHVLDVLGVNYYPTNQWVHGGPPIERGHALYRPFREIVGEIADRYHRPILVAETGAEGDARADWLRYVAEEVRAASRAGADVRGLCWYPIADHPGWDDDRHCPNGLLGYLDDSGSRPVCAPLAAELARQQQPTAPDATPDLRIKPVLHVDRASWVEPVRHPEPALAS